MRVELLLQWAALAAAAPPTPAVAPPATEALDRLPSFGDAFVEMLLVLGVIVVVLLVAARYLPRWLGQAAGVRSGKLIEVVDARRIEPRRSLYVVKVAGRYLLMSSTEHGLQAVTERELDADAVEAALREVGTPKRDTAAEVAEPGADPGAGAFARVLRKGGA